MGPVVSRALRGTALAHQMPQLWTTRPRWQQAVEPCISTEGDHIDAGKIAIVMIMCDLTQNGCPGQNKMRRRAAHLQQDRGSSNNNNNNNTAPPLHLAVRGFVPGRARGSRRGYPPLDVHAASQRGIWYTHRSPTNTGRPDAKPPAIDQPRQGEPTTPEIITTGSAGFSSPPPLHPLALRFKPPLSAHPRQVSRIIIHHEGRGKHLCHVWPGLSAGRIQISTPLELGRYAYPLISSSWPVHAETITTDAPRT